MNAPKMVAMLTLFLVSAMGSVSLVRDTIHLREWKRVGQFFDNEVTRRLRRAVKMDALVVGVGLVGMLGMLLSEVV